MIDHDESMCAEPHIKGTRVSVWAVRLAYALGESADDIAALYRVTKAGVYAALGYTSVRKPPEGYVKTMRWVEGQDEG